MAAPCMRGRRRHPGAPIGHRSDGKARPRSDGPLLDEVDLVAEVGQDLVLALVVDHLVLLEQVSALGVDGDDQRAELVDAAGPQGLGHAQLAPVGVLDLLDLGRGEHRAAGGEHAVDGGARLAAGLGVGTHAALAHDDLDTRLLDELLLELLHAHGGGGSERDHLVRLGAVLVFCAAHDGAGVEDGAAAEVDGQLAAELDQAAVRDVAASGDVAGQVDDVTDADVFQIFCGNRRVEYLFHSSTPLCVRSS